ncbi:MAG: hypothetical protein PHY71_02265 [Bacteroidaceae bacterium]|nr:hypothetical protein [Bacteroidaceae bacterium]
MTNLDVIIENLQSLKKNHEEHGNDEEYDWWNDECGCSLAWQIDCHPVFIDSTPCLNDVRKVKYQTEGWSENCEECKARWLMENYE